MEQCRCQMGLSLTMYLDFAVARMLEQMSNIYQLANFVLGPHFTKI